MDNESRSPCRERSPGRSERLLRMACGLAVLAFPVQFRVRQREALLQTLADDVPPRSHAMRWPHVIANLADVIRAGLAERLFGRRGRRAPAAVTGPDTLSIGDGVVGPGPIARWRRDLRHGWRSVAAHPVSSLATAFVFCLGVGLFTTMFALADPYVLRPLPYEDPQELVRVQLTEASNRGAGPGRRDVGPDLRVPSLDEWRTRTDLFQGVAAYTHRGATWLRTSRGLLSVDVTDVSTNFFEVLGTTWASPPAWQPASLSDQEVPILVTSRADESFGGVDRAAVSAVGPGPSLKPVGRLPEGVLFPEPRSRSVDAVSAFETGPLLTITTANDGYSYSRGLTVVARMQPGISPSLVATALRAMLPADTAWTVRVERLSDAMTRDVRPLALGALAAGTLVLLACAGNVANLLAARGVHRSREFSTRRALGASRIDLARLCLVEVGLISAGAVTAGCGLAWFALRACALMVPEKYVALGAPILAPRVVMAGVLAGLAVAAIGLVPRLATIAITADRHIAGGVIAGRLRFTFTAAQSALALVLAIGAAMLVQSFANLSRFDLGRDRTALTVDVQLHRPDDLAAQPAQFDVGAGLDRLRRIPGVQAVSARRGGSTAVGGGAVEVNGENSFVWQTEVLPGFFDAAGVRILAGRELRPGDEHWNAVIVNEAFVRTHWAGGPAIGRILTRGGRQAEVVGVVHDSTDLAFSIDSPPAPMLFSLLAAGLPGERGALPTEFQYVVRVAGDPDVYVTPIRDGLGAVHAGVVVGDVETYGGRLADLVRDRTFATLVLGVFAGVSGAVTLAGLVGIVVFIVACRTREIAIRMAVGAPSTHIMALVVREAIVAAATGALVGLLAGRWLSMWLQSLVFRVEAGNWTTTVAAAAIGLTLMVVAALVPARRATRLQPHMALRVE